MPPDFLSGDEWPGSDHPVRDSRGTDAGLGLAVWPLPRSNGDAKGQEGGRGRVVADYGSGSQAMVDAGRCRTLRSRSWSAIGWRWTVARPRPSHPGFPSAGGTAANSRFAAMTAGRRWLSLDCRIRVGARDARVCYDTWGVPRDEVGVRPMSGNVHFWDPSYSPDANTARVSRTCVPPWTSRNYGDRVLQRAMRWTSAGCVCLHRPVGCIAAARRRDVLVSERWQEVVKRAFPLTSTERFPSASTVGGHLGERRRAQRFLVFC
jgi:hypothetical protein